MTRADMDMHRFFTSVCTCVARFNAPPPPIWCKSCGGFSLTLHCEITCDTAGIWVGKKSAKKRNLHYTSDFVGVVLQQNPSGDVSVVRTLSLTDRWETQVGRQRGKHTVSGNNALFYWNAFRDQLLNFTLAYTAHTTQYLALSLKYKCAPPNLSLHASLLCVPPYIMQQSGTTYHFYKLVCEGVQWGVTSHSQTDIFTNFTIQFLRLHSRLTCSCLNCTSFSLRVLCIPSRHTECMCAHTHPLVHAYTHTHTSTPT